MSVTTVGLDLAKSAFQVHGVDAGGHAVLKRCLRRQGLLAFFEELPRGLLSEIGIVAAKGLRRVDDLRRGMEGTNESVLPREARTALDALFDHLDALTARLVVVDREILAWHKTSEASQRLATAPGVGPLTATALIAAVGDAVGAPFRGVAWVDAAHVGEWESRAYRSDQQGRGSLPAHAPDHGARAMVGTSPSRGWPRPWLQALIARRSVNVTAVAVAHKTARALWAMIRREGGVSASGDVRSRGLTEIGAAPLAASACEGSKR